MGKNRVSLIVLIQEKIQFEIARAKSITNIASHKSKLAQRRLRILSYIDKGFNKDKLMYYMYAKSQIRKRSGPWDLLPTYITDTASMREILKSA